VKNTLAGVCAAALALCAAPGVLAATQSMTAQAQPSATDVPAQAKGMCRQRATLPADRPRIGVVLGGGGARGISHISVLRTLEQLQVPVDCIAGTSIGSLVGALYASGMTVEELEDVVTTMDWDKLFANDIPREERSYRRKRDDELVIAQPGVGISSEGLKVTTGLLTGENIMLMFGRLVEPVSTIEDFDNLPIPFRAIAADINDGSAVVIKGGDLALAMRASMSIPGAFPPVLASGKVLVDGGIANNLPVEVLRGEGADIIIAVDVGTPLSEMTPHSSVLALTGQLTGLLTVRNTRRSIEALGERDVLITPPLGDRVATADFDKFKEALAIGLEGVEPVRDRLAQLGLPAEAYAQNRAVRTGRQTSPPVIEFVRLDNQSRYRDAVAQARIKVPLGQPLDAAALERQLLEVYGYDTLSQATYEVLEEGGKTGLVLHLREKNEGPNYLETGLSMSSDFEGRFDFNFRLGLLRSPVNDIGGEVRGLLQIGDESQLMGEYFQPFGTTGRFQFITRAQYLDRKINQFNANGDKLAEFSVRQIGLQAALGREFGNHGALTVGIRRSTGEAEVLVGDPGLPSVDFDSGDVYVDASLDRMDSLFFPRNGYILRNRYTFSRTELGAGVDFEQYDLDAIGARSFGAHAVQLALRFHATTSGVAPLQSVYRAGGFSRLVGFTPNEITGQDYGVLLGGYTYQLGEVFGQKALVGGSLEYGNVWQRRTDMDFADGILNGSLFIGADTWVGPMMLGIGAREGGHMNLFLTVGETF
jgi:NTE family protein